MEVIRGKDKGGAKWPESKDEGSQPHPVRLKPLDHWCLGWPHHFEPPKGKKGMKGARTGRPIKPSGPKIKEGI